MTIVEMLVRNASLYARETALIELTPSRHYRKEINWQELDERSNRLANALIERGIGSGDRVILLMMNSICWLEAYFGILKSGAWAVPLNFRFTAKDIQYCADISAARMMIYGPEFTERVDSARPQMPLIEKYIFAGINPLNDDEGFEALLFEASPVPLRLTRLPQDICGLYFTSGTTGVPKPIALTHKNMECAAITEQKHHHQVKEDNFLLLPPLYHTGAKMHWFGSLMTGGRATILTEITPENIFEAVTKEQASIVWLLVPWAQDILGALDRRELRQKDYDLSFWRLMHIGAQPVPPSLVRHWKEYFPVMQYDTNYGLSESTGPGCVHLGIENEHKVGAIGKPGFNWQARIVDEHGQDVVAGKVGELMVKGDGIMHSYYKNPGKTAETIKAGWLYTGDMARMDGEGFIYLVDRKKDIVIVGGENIFPVEIEDILRSHPMVYDAAVIGIPDERLGEIPLAVITLQPGNTLNEAEIETFCEQNLPRYKRPRKIVFDLVPRNPTGKIEKNKLRQKYGQVFTV
jgi:acyl-CoA synthetase (AMP-forming)/AMP-acid ligase II